MAVNQEIFGVDLRLLRDLDRIKSSRDPGNDLSVRKRDETGQVDLDTHAGANTLVQALVLRLLTPQGELAVLGHPTYGSRLGELIGELNTETTRNRAKLYTLEALTADPRVKQVLSVTTKQTNRIQVDIAVKLLAIDSETPLNFVFPFFLERV